MILSHGRFSGDLREGKLRPEHGQQQNFFVLLPELFLYLVQATMVAIEFVPD